VGAEYDQLLVKLSVLEDIGDRMAIRKDTVSMSDILQKGPQMKPPRRHLHYIWSSERHTGF
jgi:hypothetical protein